LELLVRVRPADAFDLRSTSAKMVTKLVARNRPKPTPKGIAGTIVPKSVDSIDYCLENLLPDIRSVRVPQPSLSSPTVDQWSVQSRKSLPCIGVSGLNTLEQAQRS
jgi:hypothetical protein